MSQFSSPFKNDYTSYGGSGVPGAPSAVPGHKGGNHIPGHKGGNHIPGHKGGSHTGKTIGGRKRRCSSKRRSTRRSHSRKRR